MRRHVDEVFLNALDARCVLGGDAHRLPFFHRLVVSAPEMHHFVTHHDFGIPDFRPRLAAQFPEQRVADGEVVRTRLARLTIPTSAPSRMTGTRLIRLVSSNSAIVARSVSASTVMTSRVMTSATVRPWDFR